jgi:hypothetical protein
MLSKIREYLNKEKNLINIFLVYFFLTFITGYIDFDKRVMTFEQSTDCLRQVVQGEIDAPLVRRILVPYTVHFFHKIFHIPLSYTFAGFRFAFFFLSFILFHIYLKKWFDDKVAMVGTLSLIASLPIVLTNWYCVPTDMPELIIFILGAMWIRDNKYKNLFILIPLATLNRETSIALVFLYFLNGIGKEKWRILIKRTMIYSLLWLIPHLTLISIFGLREVSGFFYVLKSNIACLIELFKTPSPYNYCLFLFYFCGFYWILAFRDFRKKDTLLKRSVIMMAVYFVYGFLRVGAVTEVRIFLPFYVFVIPLGLFSLFKEERSQ